MSAIEKVVMKSGGKYYTLSMTPLAGNVCKECPCSSSGGDGSCDSLRNPWTRLCDTIGGVWVEVPNGS